jgi:hypothetical protein
MKKGPILLAALVIAAAAPRPARAQVSIKAGVSHGNISGTGVLPGDLNGRTGLVLGLALATAPTQPLGFGIEGLYAQRGANSGVNATGYDLDYVDVPLYLRLMVPTPGIQPFAYAGPQVSFEVRCRAGAETCPNTDRAKTTYAGVIGAGVRLGGRSGLSVEGRYVYGLKDLKLTTIQAGDSYKSRSFQILVGIGF